MKKIILIALALLSMPLAVSAIAVPWNRPAVGIIHPQYIGDKVGIGTSTNITDTLTVDGDYFQFMTHGGYAAFEDLGDYDSFAVDLHAATSSGFPRAYMFLNAEEGFTVSPDATAGVNFSVNNGGYSFSAPTFNTSYSSGVMAINATQDGTFAFTRGASTTDFYISSGGRVMVGTTTASAARFTVVGLPGTTYPFLIASSSASVPDMFSVRNTGAVAINGSTGSSGQILQSNGSTAAPTWIATSSLGTGQVLSGTTCQTPYYASNGTVLTATSTICITQEKVGIKTAVPLSPLHVTGVPANGVTDVLRLDASVSGADLPVDIRLGSNNAKGIRLIAASSSLAATPNAASMQFYGNDSTSFPGQLYLDSGSHANAKIAFRTAASGAITDRMTIKANGFIGMGTSTPETGLHILGADTAARMQLSVQSTGTSGGISLYNSAGTRAAYWYFDASTVFFSQNGRNLNIDGQLFIHKATGSVGIGTTTPNTPVAYGLLVTTGAIANISNQSTMTLQSTSNLSFTGVNMLDETGDLTGSFQIGNSNVGVVPLRLHMFMGARKTLGDLIFTQGPASTVLGMWDNGGSFVIGASTTPSATRLTVHQYGGNPTIPIFTIASSTSTFTSTTTLFTVNGNGVAQARNLYAFGPNAEFRLYNTNDSSTNYGFNQATYDGYQFGWIDDTTRFAISKAFLGGDSIVGTIQDSPVILSYADFKTVLDDGNSNGGVGGKWAVGTTTNTTARLTVHEGDVYVASSTRGIILKSPDGTCARGTISDIDVLSFASVTCPS